VWSDPNLPSIEVRADVTEELGSEVNVLFGVDAPPVAVEETMAAVDEPAEEAVFLLQTEAGDQRAIFCARVDARTQARPGAAIRLSLDPSRFHFFDPESGLAIGRGATATTSARHPDGARRG
jgi:multiple sugar transport system ATP-binding protein